MTKDVTISDIVAAVRQSAPKGCRAEYVARMTGVSVQSVRKALDLQVQAGVLSSEEIWKGEQYVCCLYRMRGGV
jgi:hypothetical protein